ncbi:HD domain-containing phosphohydrolase [Oceanobacter mangrovi]|uniref:response regulator n=1 Tax=Oceanobacter mangrovi TaxID=2862510 RepID=UPI001C8D968F|nr:HD domain-containing phosphohydrolase [Oceanobacter mangrovi]
MGSPVLVVDDEPQNLATLRQILSPDYKLIFARSGEEALQMAARHLPVLVLLDMDMPGMSGLETCRSLRQQPQFAQLPIIFVTSHSSPEDETAAFDAGAVDFITKPVSAPVVRARVRTHLSLVRSARLERVSRDAINMLGMAGHFSDSDTGAHIWRMAAFSATLAKAIGWDSERSSLLELAAPMHDTGKIGIPAHILKKPGPLTDDEWEIMRRHPQIGHDILCCSDEPVFRLAAEIAICHHERWDGKGYPNSLKGEEIPESARIVAIADVFDALTMDRPYKDAWPLEKTLAVMEEGAGHHFDPHMWEIFKAVLPEILAVKEEWDAKEPTMGLLPR